MAAAKPSYIPEATRRFREAYRSQMPGWYNGYVHVIVVTVPALAALWVFTQMVENPTWLELMTVPVGIVGHSFIEWLLHGKVMHRSSKFKPCHAIFSGHALNHHRFFTDKEMRVRDHRDWRAVIFPPYAMLVFITLPTPFVAFTYLIDIPNVGWLFIFTTTMMCTTYEFMHFIQHLPDNKFLRWCPIVNTMRRHHLMHHIVPIMGRLNINATLPISDWFFGTCDLNRSLLGIIFNGYNMKHVKKGLWRDLPPRPDEVPPLVEPYTEAELKPIRGSARERLMSGAAPFPQPAR